MPTTAHLWLCRGSRKSLKRLTTHVDCADMNSEIDHEASVGLQPVLPSLASCALAALLALALLALAPLCCAASASANVPSSTCLRSGCRSALAFTAASNGEGEENEEESEEESGEPASAEARAEEAASTPGSSSIRGSNPSNSRGSDRGAGGNVVVLSRLHLTTKAAAALRRHRPSASTVGFSFLLSATTTVRVTLLEQTGHAGEKRWAALPDSLTFSAGKGRVSQSLTGHNTLSPGHYRLTVKPTGGSSRSIYLNTRP
jgi:hypothetical protein